MYNDGNYIGFKRKRDGLKFVQTVIKINFALIISSKRG